jgi:hypothetical protein
MTAGVKYHVNSKHEYGKKIFSNRKLAKSFLDDNNDGHVSVINVVALEPLLGLAVPPQYS